uniref:Uncharacterized protein n=1 Tax=Glossina pallidipes TaxID=7398 RepID=A0A1A9ZAV8_GLOPL
MYMSKRTKFQTFDQRKFLSTGLSSFIVKEMLPFTAFAEFTIRKRRIKDIASTFSSWSEIVLIWQQTEINKLKHYPRLCINEKTTHWQRIMKLKTLARHLSSLLNPRWQVFSGRDSSLRAKILCRAPKKTDEIVNGLHLAVSADTFSGIRTVRPFFNATGLISNE